MASWFGGLSSLKGQLSHLITEGTEEIADPNIELSVAKKKILELEGQRKYDSNEIQELKDVNNDLKMKLQSEELLLQNISESYQEKLKQKEDIIESLTNQISIGHRNQGNQRNDPDKSASFTESNDGFSIDYLDGFNFSKDQSKNSLSEIDALKQENSELNQELVKWQGFLEKNSNLEMSIEMVLENQKFQMEIQHNNDILDLQEEHNKQVKFLKEKIQQLKESLNTDFEDEDVTETDNIIRRSRPIDEECSLVQTESASLDSKNWTMPSDKFSLVATKDQIEYLLDTVAEKLVRKEATMEVIIQRILGSQSSDLSGLQQDHVQVLSEEEHLRDANDHWPGGNHMLWKIPTQAKPAITDSMSQVSDISVVSIKSRILEEHVRNLSNQLNQYEQQFGDIEHLSGLTEDSADIRTINSKIENLKVKLSQRKHVGNGHPDLPECPDEEKILADSWENSSVNSLVEENTELQQQQQTQPDLKTPGDIKDLFLALFPDRWSSDCSCHDMFQAIAAVITSIKESRAKLEKEIVSLSNDLGCGIDPEQPWNLTRLVDELLLNFHQMKEMCSVHDDIVEESKSLRDLVDQLQTKLSVSETDRSELIAKNSEMDGQLIDMSITIARYEGLEQICDRYQKHMSTNKTSLSMDSEDILEHVETFNQEKDECIQSLESKIVSLQNLCEEKDDYISDLKRREQEIVYEYDSLIEVLKSELESVRANADKHQDQDMVLKKRVQELQDQVVQKEAMITSLNQELTMLSVIDMEDSAAVVRKQCGDALVQTDSSGNGDLSTEMEQWNEALILENQRLEKVLEAQASSLAQYEIKVNNLDAELLKIGRTSVTNPEDFLTAEDMTKETLHHLSQMIRDKDWELEALKAKNDSLCSIIKTCSGDAAPPDIDCINDLLQEKEALVKELNWYHENREQLISSLNLKHKESLNYHGELQRLISYINVEQTKWEDLVVESEQLKKQIQLLMEENSSMTAVNSSSEDAPIKQLVDVGVSICLDESNSTFEEVKSYAPLKDKCLQLEEEIRRHSLETRTLQKQNDQISFELEQAHLQISELSNGLTHSQQQLEYCQNQMAANHDKEMNPARPVDTAKDIWNTEYQEDVAIDKDVTIGDNNRLMQQLSQAQANCENYAHQIEQFKTRESKLLKEKQIFQDHLIKIEESYTQDATLAEDREQSLRKQLHLTEDDLQAANGEILRLQKIAASIRSELNMELNAVRLERDEALLRLKETERQLSDHTKSLANLQAVLDSFQQDQDTEMVYQKERMLHDLNRVTSDRDSLSQRCFDLQAELDAQRELVDAAQRLTDQMEHKEDQLAQIQALLAKKEELIDSLKMEIRKLNTFTESKVDKVLMKNLVIGYFHTPQHRRQEALKVIGSLLQFADADYSQIGIDTANKSRWFSWLRPNLVDKTLAGKDSEMTDKLSFSELFISFLEKESTPLPQVKLPTNQIAAEARQHSSLSQSQEYPYFPSSSSVMDHHKFFTMSPVITKRNGSPSTDQSENPDNQKPKDSTYIYIPSIKDLGSEGSQKEQKSLHNHRRSDSGKNALLSLLDQ